VGLRYLSCGSRACAAPSRVSAVCWVSS